MVTWLGSPMNEELAEPGRRAFSELRAYTETLVVPADPGDNNLLDDVVRAHLAEGGFSTDECVMAVISLLLGDFETTIQDAVRHAREPAAESESALRGPRRPPTDRRRDRRGVPLGQPVRGLY